MERADLLYSGLMFAAGMLSLWTALLLTATFVALAPSLRKSAPGAATISSTSRSTSALPHGAEEPTPPRSLSEALPQRSRSGAAFASYSITESGSCFRKFSAAPSTIFTPASPARNFSPTPCSSSASRWSRASSSF